MKFLPNIILLCVVYSLRSELIQVIQIARHAARSPLSNQFQIPQYFPKLGEVTHLGMVQAYYLGQEMRARYMENSNFLPKYYDPSQVLLKSSGKTRALISAICFANGLYPQNEGMIYENEYASSFSVNDLLPLRRREKSLKQSDIERIKVNIDWAAKVIQAAPVDHDMTFHAEDETCSFAAKLLSRIEGSEDIKTLEEFYQGYLYPQLTHTMTKIVGPEIVANKSFNIRVAKNVLDIYRSGSFHNIHLPQMYKIAWDLLQGLDYYYVYNIKFKDPRILSISTTTILQEIANFTRKAEERPLETPKYIFYLAHDRNLQALSKVLFHESKIAKDVQFNLVPFSSVMSIELHKESVANNEQYYIKVFFNDEPQIIKWCVAHKCPLKQFLRIVERSVSENIDEMCQKEDN